MKWITTNRLYLYKPTEREIKETNINNHKKLFIIIDEAYFISKNFDICINYLKNNLNKKILLRFIFIRSYTQPKKVSKIHKESIRNMFNSWSNIFVESVTNFYIKIDTDNSNVFRITNIPNTISSDYICCGTNMFDKSILLRISGTIGESIVDGIGMRYVIFTQGCPHHCVGCQNAQTWDFEKGTFVSINSLFNDIIQNPMLNGVTFSGGEPFIQPYAISKLIDLLSYYYNSQNKPFNYTTYTGYSLEQLQEMCIQKINKNNNKYFTNNIYRLLYKSNYIVDGRFELDKKSLECKFRGSTNQKMYEHLSYDSDFIEIYPVES